MSTLVKLSQIVIATLLFALLLGPSAPAGAESFDVTNLVTDDQSVNAAHLTDPHLKNAWGIAHSSMSPFWVSANGAGLAVLYNVNPTTNVTSKLGLEVTIPGAGNVTGQAFNGTAAAFNGDAFLFVSEDGTISGWRGALGNAAETLQLASAANVYKGTTQVMVGGHAYLLSANFRAGTIDVLKGEAGSPDLAGHFTDPNLPSGFAPFNVQVLGGKIYVAYAQQDAAKHDDVAGAGHGFVTEFDTNGNFLRRIATQGTLDSPWGLAIAPASFGALAGDLLVGNFGDGRINVFNLTTLTSDGQLPGANGTPLDIDGLWALIPGNDGNGGNSSSIYFSAGPGEEIHGLFGVIAAVPEPSTALLLRSGIGTGWLVLRRRRSGA